MCHGRVVRVSGSYSCGAFTVPMIDLQQPAPRARERYESKFKLMAIAEKITRYGWLIDRDRLAQHLDGANKRAELYHSKFISLTGQPPEILGRARTGNTLAMRRFFKEELGAPDVSFDKRTRKPQFNTASLIEWANTKGAPYAGPAASLYALRKNLRTADFCRVYELFSRSEGRIHFQFNVVGTQTGRWTSATRLRLDGKTYSCNAQQIPKREPTFDFGDGNGDVKLCVSLRDIFIADKGHALLVADFDQLELRLIAYVYGVRSLIEALNRGTDIHLLVASKLWPESGINAELPRDKSSAKKETYRSAAKSCAYAIAYQMSLPGRTGKYPTLHKTLLQSIPKITPRAVADLADRYFRAFPEIKEGMARTQKQIERHGFAELTIDGRRLYYPDTMRGWNQALNFPMQGTGGAICDRAVLELEPQLDWDNGAQIRAQAHDEVVMQSREDEVDHYAPLLEQAMSRPAQIGATFTGIPAGAEVGHNWGFTEKRT